MWQPMAVGGSIWLSLTMFGFFQFIYLLATNFNKSSDHLERYFKRETGKKMKNYINDYKIELIKTRLKYSNFRILEIADELNFTDGNHLNKIFKKVCGKTAYQLKDTIR